MLKIYNAYANANEIKVEDKIDFKNGQFDTGLYGFGKINSGIYISSANYELQTLKSFREYLQSIKTTDGYVIDNFTIWNPMTYKMLEEKYDNVPKDFDTYEKYGLNEEAILLFTNFIRLKYSNNDLVQKIFGRYPEYGMYLILPNASFKMILGAFSDDISENYEVLQSQSLGKQLILTKLNRKI